MNTYKCYYTHRATQKEIEVEAESSYQAQCKAATHLAVKHEYQHKITVVLLAKNGVPVVHSTSEVG